jgi:ribosome-associated translation inhibitor RaiA
MQLSNPRQQRTVAEILASVPDADRARLVQRLARLERLFEQQEKFDAQVAESLNRILAGAPSENLRALSKQIRKRIKEIIRG